MQAEAAARKPTAFLKEVVVFSIISAAPLRLLVWEMGQPGGGVSWHWLCCPAANRLLCTQKPPRANANASSLEPPLCTDCCCELRAIHHCQRRPSRVPSYLPRVLPRSALLFTSARASLPPTFFQLHSFLPFFLLFVFLHSTIHNPPPRLPLLQVSQCSHTLCPSLLSRPHPLVQVRLPCRRAPRLARAVCHLPSATQQTRPFIPFSWLHSTVLPSCFGYRSRIFGLLCPDVAPP